jgi:molybdate transport system substrate-binding protein
MVKKLLIGTLFVWVSLFGAELKVAVSDNMSLAIKELKAEFKRQYPDVNVEITLGSSQKLTDSINGGAAYDIFLSSNTQTQEFLYVSGKSVSNPVVFAIDALALFSHKPLDYNKGMNLLKDKEIARVVILDPRTSLYGISAIELMKNKRVYEKVKSKITFMDSFSEADIFALKEDDIGIVAKSSLFTPAMEKFKKDLDWMEVCTKLYTPIYQGVVILTNGQNEQEAKAFYDFILSDSARKILKIFGYNAE